MFCFDSRPFAVFFSFLFWFYTISTLKYIFPPCFSFFYYTLRFYSYNTQYNKCVRGRMILLFILFYLLLLLGTFKTVSFYFVWLYVCVCLCFCVGFLSHRNKWQSDGGDIYEGMVDTIWKFRCLNTQEGWDIFSHNKVSK